MIFALASFFCFYEFGIGTIIFIHIFETNVDIITGIANQILFITGFITTLITPTLIDKLQVSGTFGFFAACNFLGFLFIAVFMR